MSGHRVQFHDLGGVWESGHVPDAYMAACCPVHSWMIRSAKGASAGSLKHAARRKDWGSSVAVLAGACHSVGIATDSRGALTCWAVEVDWL